MAKRGLFVFLILLLIIQAWAESTHISDDDAHYTEPQENSNGRLMAQIDCGSECGRRCSKASEHDDCLKYCGICCKKCNCVPPGTSGNENVCPCYADLKNSKGNHKCP